MQMRAMVKKRVGRPKKIRVEEERENYQQTQGRTEEREKRLVEEVRDITNTPGQPNEPVGSLASRK
jgi:hypothetical protein